MSNANTTTSYLDPPQLIGRPNADGTISITPLELKRLNDYNYAVAKMLQGNLNLANLNADTNEVFDGLEVSVSDLSGNLTTLSVTVDGMRIADETGSYTIIDGDKLVSKDHDTSTIVQIEDGGIKLKVGTALQGEIYGTGSGIMISPSQYLMLGGMVQVGLGNELTEIKGYPIKITSTSNASVDSLGTIYIGASSGYSGNVDIGQAGGAIHLVGDVYINGVLQ